MSRLELGGDREFRFTNVLFWIGGIFALAILGIIVRIGIIMEYFQKDKR